MSVKLKLGYLTENILHLSMYRNIVKCIDYNNKMAI